MPALAVTSNTGVVTGVGPFVVTFPLHYQRKAIFLYVDYTKSTGGTTISVGFLNPQVAAANIYQETLFATATLSPVLGTLTGSSGRYRFELEPSYDETALVVTVTIAAGDTAIVDLCRE